MKAVVSWMREFAPIPADAPQVASRLAACGFEVASVDGDVKTVGSINADDLAAVVDLGFVSGGAGGLDDGGVLERTHLELMDDLPESERWLPEIPRLADDSVEADEVLATAPAERPAPVGEPLLANPLSFET